MGGPESGEHKIISSKARPMDEKSAYGQVNGMHKATLMTTASPMPQRSFDNSKAYGGSQINFIT